MDNPRQHRIKMLRQYLTEDENDHFSRYALALEIMEEEPGTAIEQLKVILARKPDFLAAYYQLGRLLEQTGSIGQALGIYQQGAMLARQQNNLKTEQELKTAAALLAEDE